MKLKILSVFVAAGILVAFAATRAGTLSDPLGEAVRRIAGEVRIHGKAYSDLEELTSTIGARLSGSESAGKAVEWARKKLESYGLRNVTLQPVMVPYWTRGKVERATVTSTADPIALNITALGNSVGTGENGVEAEVIEVHGLDEVDRLGGRVRGKIVFFNRPMVAVGGDTFEAYGKAVDQRQAGASRAAKYGAVAALVRTMTTLPDDDYPHTGGVSYLEGIPMIPAAALSTHSANELSQLLKTDPTATVKLELSAARHPLVPSFNVMGEIPGRELPQEYVVVGGHLDSWDLATGAQDDGAGVVQSIEVLRALNALGLRPRRTVRVVCFMAEEFGGYGGREYAKQAAAKGEKHYAAIESDRGGFAPIGFEVEGDERALAAVRAWKDYLEPLHAGTIDKGESGTDVSPLDALGAVTLGYIPDPTHYFDYHHSALDRFDIVNRENLHDGAAAMAILTYLLAEKGLPEKTTPLLPKLGSAF